MTANEYQELAARTLLERPQREYTDQELMAVWTAIGIAGEAGELVDLIKKAVFHDHGLDMEKIIKEMGDVLWYVAALGRTLGIELDWVMERNIEKLKTRYPEGFSVEASLRRAEGDD